MENATSHPVSKSGDTLRGPLSHMESALRELRMWKLRAEGVMSASDQILREWHTSDDDSIYSGAMELILGILPHELPGRFETWMSLIHPDDHVAYRTQIEAVLLSGGSFEIEYRARKSNGKYTLLLERGYFITPEQGGGAVLSSVITDVSDLREMESRLRQTQRVEAFGQLVGGVAHDFNNMLSVIIGYSQIMMEETDASEENHTFLSEIEKAAARASSLTNQLLAFNKPPDTKRGRLPINELLLDISKMLKRLLGEQIELEIIPEATLWTLEADRSQIEQSFINLAVGARGTMPNGGKITITAKNVTLREAKTIHDQKIPPGDHVHVCLIQTPRLFRTSAELALANSSVKSAQTVIEQNGGRLVVTESNDDEICFGLYFPSAQETPLAPASKNTIRTAKQATILLVEDDTAMRRFTRTVLKRLGHIVITAPDGEEALALLEKSRPLEPNLLLTDMVMPRLGGLELAQKLFEKFPKMPILLMSGYPEQHSIASNSDLEFSFLRKPFATGELISKVGCLLQDA
jgi:CheY-like chemotaxis protein